MAITTVTQPCIFELQKHIGGYPSYVVSSEGTVRSLRNHIFLSPSQEKNGYRSVLLYKEDGTNTKRRYLIHRLSMIAFYGKDPVKKYVDHKDNNPRNNHISNLRWVTQSENVQKAYYLGRAKCIKAMTGKFGKLHPTSVPVVGYKDGKEVLKFESIGLARAGGYHLNFYDRANSSGEAICKGITFKKAG